ncbi:D-alanyl-D-alanine carboxypeptidase [Streptomyces xanthophaeus]|uniref:serine hydrolase domain-containing protein n=1 Tax=Streptomyces xanthophaeus TaxID=67385 RepID=UPI00233F1C42|nr:serine hydrolase domain-containing protein [Streptomyces xanthophaeus]WCD90649.1 D-alanyl-D-alanine carboxypeptidase [Streptomyces xanthophaeus]
MGRDHPFRARAYRRAAVPAAAALLLAGLCTGTIPVGGAAALSRQEFDTATVEKLDAALTKLMKEAAIPGLDVGVWIPGRGTYAKAFGVADEKTGTPMKTDLHTRIGSVTKTFTVTGLLRLVDQGKVGLDDPVSRYVAGVPGGDAITVRQLADMRSGLFDCTQDQKWLAGMRADPYRVYTPRELLDISFAHPPNFEPNAKWEYSNTNTILLGLLIEKVSGQNLSDYLEEHVFAPLKLKSTSLPTDGVIPEPYVHGYTDFTPDGSATDSSGWNPSWGWAAGAMVSNLDDLRTWSPALVDGRLLTGRTQAERLRTLPTGVPGVSYGLGILDSGGWLGHNGEIPGYESIAAQLPAEKATLVVLVSSDIDHNGKNLSSLVGNAVTSVVTPDHLWPAPVPTAPQ